jgi:hypothetical protein
MAKALLLCLLLCTRPAQAESGGSYILLVEGIVAIVSAGSSGAWASPENVRKTARIAGAVDIGFAGLWLGSVRSGGVHGWVGQSVLAGLGVYNLTAPGSVPWRFGINEVGLHLALVGAYLDQVRSDRAKSDPPPSARIVGMPGGLAIVGRF